jgi:RNA polymerase sigma-70 factor (ECF subfamily)
MSELADRLARGEPAAFAQLYDACADRLFGWLVVHLRSAADAEDVVQETFVRLARARKKLRQVENLTAYAFSIARNEAARLRKRAARQGGLVRPLSEVVDGTIALEQGEVVERALERLSDEQREVVDLKLYGDLTLREIAEITGLPPGTVATRYRAALLKLRESLTRDGCRE